MSTIIGQIAITREMSDEGDNEVKVSAIDMSGEMLGLVESLGMLELAKDVILRVHAGDYDDDEEDYEE